jgi:anti-sigma B factor antagonist
MLFSTSAKNDVTVLRIEGELDAVSVTDIRAALNTIAEGKPARVEVDLSALRVIDSSGVGAIVSLFKAVRAYGGRLTATGVHGQPLAIFRLLRLDRVLIG